MNRRLFVRLLASTAGAGVLTRMGGWKAIDNAMAQEDQVLAKAKERIEQHRKSDVHFSIQTPDGKPLANAQVTLSQTRHAFLFGCNIFLWGRLSPEREEAYRERFASLFNFATLPFYWASYEWERSKPNHAYIDRVVEWCHQQGIVCKGHPLVWDSPAGSPDRWLPDDFEEIEKLSTGRVREIIKRFEGRIDIWDVVNEPTDVARFPTKMSRWARQLGAVPYTLLHLKAAREVGPKATLLVNDYRVDDAFLRILQQLKDEQGRFLFDVVGLQSHMHRGVWSATRTWEVCERFASLGLPLHFTETTIVSGPLLEARRPFEASRWGETTPEGEERQAEAVARFYTVLFSHPAVQAITWWDLSDEGAWMRAPAGLVRRDMTPKPAYERLMALVKGEWWTKENGVTNEKGEWRCRAFYGDYTVTVRTPDGRTVERTVSVRRGVDNRIVIRLP